MLHFEWDPAKSRANKRKHGISFDIARHVFDDPDALLDHSRIEGGERRWQTLGMVDGVLLLLVAHVEVRGRRGRSDPHHFCQACRPQGETTL